MIDIFEDFAPQHFIQTKEYLRFEEFAQSCTQYKYIGICYGNPGVGKTYTANEYTQPQVLEYYNNRYPVSPMVKANIHLCRGAFFTVQVCNTPRSIRNMVHSKIFNYGNVTLRLQGIEDILTLAMKSHQTCPLLIVDEADRLTFSSLEELRAMYDEYKFGLILMGMPGIEKRLSRYAQLYSRIGFVHEFKSINKEEMKFLFEQKWQELGRQFDKNTFVDVEAMNEIIKITHGNFRLINRIFDQMQRLMQINNLTTLTKELVEAAKNCLVIGDFL